MLAACLALVLAAPAAAIAPYEGVTGQDRRVEIQVSEGGVPQAAVIEWQTRPCRHLRTQIKDRFRPWYSDTSGMSLRRAGPRSFTGVSRGGPGTVRGDTWRTTARVTGRRRGKLWVGTVSARVVFRRGGRVTEVCSMRRTRWRAGRHRASLTISGDDWVAQGNTYAADHRSHDVRASVINGGLSIEWGGDGDGEPSFGASTIAGRAGRTYEGRDVVDVSGDARACGSDVQTGTLTVESVRYDRKGWVVALVATYEQRCDAKYPAAHRGRITFRRGW